MSDIRFNVDTREVQEMMDYFKNNDWVRAEKNALRRVARAVRNYEKRLMRNAIPKATHKSEKYSDRLIDAIIVAKVRSYQNQLIVKVHTMGNRNKTSGTFRARFFNNSYEQERHTKAFTDSLGRNYKNGMSRGVLKQRKYFDENPQGVMKRTMDEEIKRTIEQVNKRKYLKK